MKIILALLGLALIYALALFGPPEIQSMLAREGSAIEIATVAAYLLFLGLIVFYNRYDDLFWLFWLALLLALRELDFDSRFTNGKVTKLSFFLRDDVPILQKVYGGVLVSAFVLAVVMVVWKHGKGFIAKIRGGSEIAGFISIAMIFAALSQLLDGAKRKLQHLNVDLTKTAATAVQILEEILELGIPIFFVTALWLYLKRPVEINA
jgi:hypothetical protein